MGACSIKSSAAEPPTADDGASRREFDDPRWDREGFERFIRTVPFVRVGYLRALDKQHKTDASKDVLIEPGSIPATELHFTLPKDCGVSGVQLFAVLSPSLLSKCADPAAELQAILQILSKADDDDLVFWYHMCVDSTSCDTTAAQDNMYRMFTHYRVQTVVVPRVAGAKHSIFELLVPMGYLALSTFCQRIVNASDPELKRGLDLPKLIDLPNLLAGLHYEGHQEFQHFSELLHRVIRTLTPVAKDKVGFRVLCEEAQIAWLRVTYLMRLAERGGPCPRRQEMDPDGIIVGRLPKGRKISLSHAWYSSSHIDPSGTKIKALAKELERLGIDGEEDGVFIDFTGLWQRGELRPSCRIEAYILVVRCMIHMHGHRAFNVCLALAYISSLHA